MGFIEDFFQSDTFKDAMAIRDEFDDFKQEVTASLIEGATNITSTLNDTAEQLTDATSDAADTVRKATDLNQ